MTSIRIFYSLLVCVIISGFAAQRVYREIVWRIQPEKTSLRLQYAGGHAALVHSEEEHDRLHRIEDVVLLPDNQALLLMRLRFMLPPKSSLSCVFSNKIATPAMGVDYREDRAALIRCEIPPHFSVSPNSVDIITALTEPTNAIMSLQKTGSRPVKWNHMVYESAVTEMDVILLAKGINARQGINAAPQALRCVFSNTVETAVTISAQEIFRCAHPPQHLQSQLSGGKITLKTLPSQIMPSAAYYNPQYIISEAKDIPKKLLCACTMVFNIAKFLEEWIIYHSHLGVEEFFIYDNNSEDNLEEVITKSVQSGYNVSRRVWPWAKTQEAGFAHCSLTAANKCKWVMFTDVDEFVFSHGWLHDPAASSNALKTMILNKTSTEQGNRVGQVSMKCRNFGASNLKEHPVAGVTQGYTCREREMRRHKSILLLEAASLSLMNAVHHFELKPGYKTVGVKSSEAVINHYKYQAWSEFREKFRRRASAYVVDWKQGSNRASQDRAPGVGFEAVRPLDWEKKFCQVNDTSLRQFTAK
ncbi:hypothetical protein KI387_032075, partial [Taxus chinensis]